MDEAEVEYAGFWIRAGATLIDTVLVMLITAPILAAIYGWKYFGAGSATFIAGPADFLISWVLPAAAVIWFWTHKKATPGKMALHLRIVNADTGGSLSLGQSIGRYFAYFLSIIPFGLGLIWVAFDSRKQGWHDKLAHTVVIRDKKTSAKRFAFRIDS